VLRAPASAAWTAYAPLAAALAAVAVYLPSLAGGFLYDDYHATRAVVRDLHNLRAILLFEPARPVLTLSWAINYALAGAAPWAYHLGNVLIHAANAALLCSLFLWIGQRLGWKESQPRALLGACLFAVSPMAAETVAYVASRSSALAALFSLAALRLALPAFAGASRWRLVPAAVAAAMALGTKEEAAALPLLLLLLDFFCVAGQRLRETVRRSALHAPFIALVALGLVARRLVTGAWLPLAESERGRYLLTQIAAFPLYLLRALIPVDPALYRGHPPAAWPPDAGTVVGVLTTLALVTIALRIRRARPVWSLSIAWMAACLAPSSSIAPLTEMVVDHRAYLGTALPCLCLATLFRPGRTLLMAGVLVALSGLALRYEWVLAAPARAWEDAVWRAPGSSLVWRSLGEAYVAQGDEAAAESALVRATHVDPRDVKSWTNLGVYYTGRGRWPEAEAAFRRALDLEPAEAQIHENLALVLRAAGQEAEAINHFETAIRLAPAMAAPKLDLAAILLRQGQRARAAALIDEAARLPLSEQDRLLVANLRDHLRDDKSDH